MTTITFSAKSREELEKLKKDYAEKYHADFIEPFYTFGDLDKTKEMVPKKYARYTHRAKRLTTGEWVFGVFWIYNGQGFITRIFEPYPGCYIPGIVQVIPDTAGLCTGVPDKHGLFIFEGDITNKGVVKWFDNIGYDLGGGSHPGFYFDDNELDYYLYLDNTIEIIGNIYDEVEK